MIVLKIKDYCNTCPYFEPKAEKYYGAGMAVMTQVVCEDRERCEALCEHLQKQLLEDDLK